LGGYNLVNKIRFKKNSIIIFTIIIGLLGFSLLGPYSLYDRFLGEKYYYNEFFSIPENRMHLFGSDSEIRSLHYLGNELYSIETVNNKKYILELKKLGLGSWFDYSKVSIEIFEYVPAAAVR
jgi:hypothetical protein